MHKSPKLHPNITVRINTLPLTQIVYRYSIYQIWQCYDEAAVHHLNDGQIICRLHWLLFGGSNPRCHYSLGAGWWVNTTERKWFLTLSNVSIDFYIYSQTFVALVFLANCLACAQPSTSIVRKLIELYNLIMEPELNFNLITSFRQLTMHYRTKYAHRSIYWYVDDMGDIMQVGTFASETGVEYQE